MIHNHDDIHEHENCTTTHEHTRENTGCACSHEHNHTQKISKKDIIILIVSTLLFIIALIVPVDIIKIITFASSVLLAGFDLFIKGFKSIIKFKFEENTLMLIAVIASFILGEYPEACIVTILFKLGEFIEGYAINRSKKSMESLTKIRPDFAVIKNDIGDFIQIDAQTIKIGDTVFLRAGDKVSVDAVVVSGQSSVDNSALTGESMPVAIAKGDTLLSGSINLTGLVECTATATFENSTASKIIDLVYASTKAKGKTEGFISRVAKVYTPIVIILAVIIAVFPPLLGFGTYDDFIMRSLIFLVASCPCALVISIPLSFFAGIGSISKQGMIVKGSTYIEKLAQINAVAFDKTGTLTNGKLSVEDVIILDKTFSKEVLFQILVSAEKGSTHPISTAILEYCKGIEPAKLGNIKELAGLGITAELDGQTVICGGENMLIHNSINTQNIPQASVYVCINKKIIAYVTINEQISTQSLTIVNNLNKVGINRVIMLTGDNETSAKKVAIKCDITEVHSTLLPVDKVKCIEEIKLHNSVLFVGDGINDAPVLTVSDLGISMGFGSEIANSSSDIILTGNTLNSIPKSIIIAKRTMRIVYANIIFALLVKLIVLVLGGLGLASMWFAVFADIGVTIIASFNAMRLFKK